MSNVKRVLGWGNGALTASVMFVGEAPGRLGAEQTGLPFHGDVAGRNFEALLEACGLSRNDVFITNAVLCNPQKEDGTNDTPTSKEIASCATHLERQIRLVNPKIVAPLGAKALTALALVEPHDLQLATSVRTSQKWFNRLLVPLYHPGQRAMVHRSFANQTADYYFLSSLLKKQSSARVGGNMSTDAAGLAYSILEGASERTLFALHKLIFLSEIASIAATGRRATSLYFVRQKDGPYCTDLATITRRKDGFFQTKFVGGVPHLSLRRATDLFGEIERPPISPVLAVALREVLSQCAELSDAQLKQRAYRSLPMRAVLKLEAAGTPCLNRPLLTPDDVKLIVGAQ